MLESGSHSKADGEGLCEISEPMERGQVPRSGRGSKLEGRHTCKYNVVKDSAVGRLTSHLIYIVQGDLAVKKCHLREDALYACLNMWKTEPLLDHGNFI